MDGMEAPAGIVKRLLLGAAWAPIGVLVAHSVGAHYFGHEPVVDPIMHFAGGAAAAFFVRRSCDLGRGWLGSPTPFAADLLSFGLACTIALFWEFGEQLSDLYLGTRAHTSVGGTLGDLRLGVLGAGLYLLLARLGARLRR